MAARLRSHAEVLGSRFVLARPTGDEPDFDFAENISLALAVCEDLAFRGNSCLRAWHIISATLCAGTI